MITYISAFIFYTLAMIGIMLIGFVIYKKTFGIQNAQTKGMIKVLDSINIAPKKSLMVVKVKNEKFLIASGAEHTTFLSKLSDEIPKVKQNIPEVSQNVEKSELQSACELLNNLAKPQDLSPKIDEMKNLENINLRKKQKEFMDLFSKEENINQHQFTNKKDLIKALVESYGIKNQKGAK